jgi:hypothetical protein
MATMIDGWECIELWPGEAWAMRTASRRDVELQADADGLDIEELCIGHSGASGRVGIPANVLMWLAQAVRL